MLHSMADFDAFKELMLSAKAGLAAEAAGGSMCVSGGALRSTRRQRWRVCLASTTTTYDDAALAPDLNDALSISTIGK